MKKLLGILIAIMTTISSQASTNPIVDESSMTPTVSVTQPKTATQSVQARVKHKKVIKTKLVNLKVQRFFAVDDDDDIYVQEEDLATGYRRRDLTKIEHEDGISEKVRWRLFLARQLAMLKYRELHG